MFLKTAPSASLSGHLSRALMLLSATSVRATSSLDDEEEEEGEEEEDDDGAATTRASSRSTVLDCARLSSLGQRRAAGRASGGVAVGR